jgi:hypothetical protein
MTLLAFGNCLLSGEEHDCVRLMSGAVVTTIAGGVSGTNAAFSDGAGSNAGFNLPLGLVVDAVGTIYLADANNHLIRKVSPAGGTCASARLHIGNASVGLYASGCQRCDSHEEARLAKCVVCRCLTSRVSLSVCICVSLSGCVCLCLGVCLRLSLRLSAHVSVYVCVCVHSYSCSLACVCVRVRVCVYFGGFIDKS